jgi:hypothetical protein
MSKKRQLVLLFVFLCGVTLIVLARRAHHPSRQDIADALKHAGYKQDDKGRTILDPNAPISLAFDPNQRDPTTGLRACVNGINSCYEATSKFESCIDSAPRCVSATPWKDDPGGDECCPESCVQEYHELRKTKPQITAFRGMIDGTCYPGMKALLSGKTP